MAENQVIERTLARATRLTGPSNPWPMVMVVLDPRAELTWSDLSELRMRPQSVGSST
jgi:hypothetical protein